MNWKELHARHTHNNADRWIRRMRCQIEFVAALGSYPELVEQAQALDADDLSELCARVEEVLAPAEAEAKSFTIHCVGHGHIDMNWMWSWPETVATTYDTFASVLSLMRQYPDFTYSQSQASVYELIDRYHPAMAEEIGERIREGRWEVTAAQWVEGDKNIAQGEALARSYLYTRKWFLNRYGLEPEDVPVQWEPDTFGHANTMPSIAALGGVKYYYACRTGGGFDHEGETRPPMFWWQGPDGARILVNREISWYNSYVNIGDNIALPGVEFFKANGLRHWLNVYGIGNHGGGPTRREIDYYLEMREWPVYPQVSFSTARRYFEACEASGLDHLPVLDHELNFEFTGCYTSQSLIKEANRLGENQCLDSEALLALAHLAGLPRPAVADQLETAWRNVLFNQFHDILPGSGVRETREHARGLFQETAAITASIKREVMGSVCQRLPGADSGAYEGGAGLGAGLSGLSMPTGSGIVVFNPLCWTRTDLVRVTLWDTGFDPNQVVAVDPEGVAHSTFLIEQKEEWGHVGIALWFYASDVPGLGYKAFTFREGSAKDAELVQILPKNRLVTPHMEASFDRYSAGVSVGDLKFGEILSTVETPRYMTSWVLGGAESPSPLIPERFDLLGEERNVATLSPGGQNILVGGEHRMKVWSSSLKLRTMVHSRFPRVDFEGELDWREIGDMERGIPGLMIRLGGGIPTRRQTPFGSVAADATRDDEPTLGYVQLSNGVTVLTETKSGFRASEEGVAFRLIRSSFDPDHAPEVNRQTFRFSVVLGEKTPSELNRLAKEWQHPLIACASPGGDGSWPLVQGFAEGEIESIRPGSDGGLVVSLVDHGGKGGSRSLDICGASQGTPVDWMDRDMGVAGPLTVDLAPSVILSLKVE